MPVDLSPDPSPDRPVAAAGSPRFRAVAAGLLVVFGVQVWLVLGRGYYGSRAQRWSLLAALGVALIPPLARPIGGMLDRLRRLSPRARAVTAATIALLAAGYFVFTAHYQQRTLLPKYLDEQSYAIGIQQAARLRLWMPQHPAADSFEALELIVEPVYASMYFPGTAILYAPSVWFHLPYWLLPALAAGACVGLAYRVVAELMDGLSGLLVAAMLVGTSIFRLVSVMLLAQVPVLLMVLLATWAWLRWRREKRLRWAAALGFFAGWALVCRPLDAVALLAPVGIAVLLDVRPDWRLLPKTLGAAALAALPFVAMQVAFNLAVTGTWHRTPFHHSHQTDYPGATLGFHPFDETVRPASSLPQKQVHYENVTAPALGRHRPETLVQDWATNWLPKLVANALPHVLLLVLVPVGWLAWHDRRWVLASGFIAWVLLYAFYVFKLPHYAAVLAPATAVMVVCGIDALRRAWPRLRHEVTVFFAAAVVILSATETAELNRIVRDEWFDGGAIADARRLAENLPEKPAVILFTYDRSITSEIDPVYNSDVAWPDDAPVVRAHDRPEHNAALIRHYARHQPGRVIYRFDRVTETLQRLGTARELAGQLPPSP